MGGFNITCVVNYNQARVDLTLGHSDRAKNKRAFDYLYSHRSQIDQVLGEEVEWLRSDNTKGSYIVMRLNGVSIVNEADWTQMAKFHAEWSKKFYDVFVPYLKQKY